MDNFVVKTAAAYDSKTRETQTVHERNKGVAAPLKQRHNAVKRALIRYAAQQSPRGTLLDIGCGRGGDLRKWIDAGLSRVKGLDVSTAELHEAARRFEEMHVQRGKTRVTFEYCDRLGAAAWTDPDGPYDIITSMFSLHYFWRSKAQANLIMQFVSANLRPGGLFMGVVPDGKRINALLMDPPPPGSHSPRLDVVAHWDGKPEAFGSAYFWEIDDTVTGGSGSLEFLVYESILATLAEKYDLTPVLDADIEGTERSGGIFRHVIADDGHPASTTAAAFIFRRAH